MFRKKKWIVWLSVFLSLPLLAVSPSLGDAQGETQRAVEEVHQPATASYGAITQAAAAQAALPAINEARWYEFWSQQKPKVPKKKVSVSHSHEIQQENGHCGGNLPPCWVLDRESGYNDGNPNTYDIHAYNASGCGGRGCRGKWQCDPGSCSGTGSEEEQDAEAAALWDNGNGCSHWNACG